MSPTRTIEQIREDHFPLMVLKLAEYIRLHGDPAIVAEALQMAAQAELNRVHHEETARRRA
jgi:hypothetical protein